MSVALGLHADQAVSQRSWQLHVLQLAAECVLVCSVPSGQDESSHIVFTFKLQPGACPKSYGLRVAALAGIPLAVRSVAAELGALLEANLGKCFATHDDAALLGVPPAGGAGGASLPGYEDGGLGDYGEVSPEIAALTPCMAAALQALEGVGGVPSAEGLHQAWLLAQSM